MANDPVCGMMVDLRTAEFKTGFNSGTYYFCSNACKLQFERDPFRYLKKKGFIARFLERLASANAKEFKGKPPTCCGQ